MRLRCLLFLPALVGCRDAKDPTPQADTDGLTLDADGDGFAAGDDCDDEDATINPAAVEACDGLDNDCDGRVDADDDSLNPGSLLRFYADADEDGYGDPGVVVEACEAPPGTVADFTDCDDTDPAISPGAVEVCDEADIDEDCDGASDDDDDSLDPGSTDRVPYWPDRDGDGFGDSDASGRFYCEATDAVSANAADCDDTDPRTHPGADELADGADNDCDSATTEDGLATFFDEDGVARDALGVVGGGAPGAPVVVTLTDSGTLGLGAGTWVVNLTVQADLVIEGTSGDPAAVVLDADSNGPAIDIDDPSIEVTVRDLTVQSGTGSESLYGDGLTAGGNILCSGGAPGATTALTLEGVVVQGGDADYGGGIAAYACALTTLDTTVADNTAGRAGGLMVHGATWSDLDGKVTGNAATNDFGQVWIYESDATMDGSSWTDGFSASNISAVAVYDGSLVCKGSEGALAGIYGNVEGANEYGAVYVRDDATFEAIACDFGTEADGTANTPADITVGSAFVTYDFGDDANVTCDGEACTEVLR